MKQWSTRIAALADLRAVSGREAAAAKAICHQLQTQLPEAETQCKDGSVILRLAAAEHKPHLMLCAHLDQVGFFVTDLTEDGFLRIGQVGGIDRRLLLGQPVVIYGAEPLFGVISILPPHLLKGEQAVPSEEQLCVDIGYGSAAELKDLVRRGDTVCFAATCKPLQNNRLTGSALDDRCGVAAVLAAAEQIAAVPESERPYRVSVVLSAQEERGSRGAKLAALSLCPDIAIAVDVTFAMSPGETPHGCMTLGNGPAIGISSVLDESLSQALINTAKQHAIPYQLEIMPDGTGTDADWLALAPGGAAAATVSIPLQYMHTPVEVLDCSDVAQTAALLSAFALGKETKE